MTPTRDRRQKVKYRVIEFEARFPHYLPRYLPNIDCSCQIGPQTKAMP